ncbi:MAG: single-stranded-DNA-specific exonuclease RecJ [Robiginitomaculum sp.]|nr:MAG: single-stranded-DNA-specific exonuclease RecJ [Robiginitomaculum sp.]
MTNFVSNAPLLDVQDSVRGRKWVLRCGDDDKIIALTRTGLSQTSAQLLAGRGITPQDAQNFLNPTLRNLLPDPSSLQDMDKAAKHILDAVQARKKITVFADYDVDGGTSAAQLIRWARAIGITFGLYVPDRIKEGYGPSEQAFRQLKDEGNDLVITVDCGASATQALHTAAEIELPVIVIDHHMMVGDLPPTLALVNPNRADDTSGLGHLAAAGVTFVLLVALNREAKARGMQNTPNLLDFLDLTALGTICDVVPLKGLNRAFVAQGLKVLTANPNFGLAALADVAGVSAPFTTYHGGFILGPRINAGGRIGQADMGAKLLSSDDEAEVIGYAQELDKINAERKLLQDRILEEAKAKAASLPKDHKVTIVAMEGWHAGVIGIVAGRLKDLYGRPAIVIGVDEYGAGKGSGRSLSGVNLGAAIHLAKEKGLIEAGGGHEMAAGLTVHKDKIEAFSQFMEMHLAAEVEQARKNSTFKVDVLLHPSAVNAALIEEIESVGPYGANMPEPVFAFANMRISYAKRLNGGHVRCAFEDNSGVRLSGIAFRAEENGMADILLTPNPPIVHVAARLKQDSWQGRTRIDVQLVDLALVDK